MNGLWCASPRRGENNAGAFGGIHMQMRAELGAETISIIFVYSVYRVLFTLSFSDILSFCNKYNCHHYTYNSYVYILIIHLKTA